MIDAPPKPTVRITVKEFIDSIEKNGWEQSYGSLMENERGYFQGQRFKKDSVVKACAFGQGMLNNDIRAFANFSSNWPLVQRLYKYISGLNDRDLLAPDVIAEKTRKEFKADLNEVLEAFTFEDVNKGMIYVGGSGLARG
jgi:hypothetical protein